MNNGIHPSEDLVSAWNDVKSGSLKCWILQINSQDQLELVFKGDKDFTWKDLPDQLPKNDARFVLFDFDFLTDDIPIRKVNKLISILWCPLTAPSKQRFLYSSTQASLCTALGAISKQIQAADYSDLDYDTIKKLFAK